MPEEPTAAADHQHASSDGAVCFGCGYALQGLDVEGVCPECGYPIERSIHGAQLVNSSPEYVRSLLRGVTTVITGMLLSLMFDVLIVVFVMVMVVEIVLDSLTRGAPGGPPRLLQIVPTLATATTALIIFLGWWMASTPDPGYRGRNDGSKARLWLRASVGILAVAQLLSTGLGLMMSPTGGVSLWVVGGTMLVGLVALLAWGVWFFASLQYLRWLSPRLPDPMIDRKAKRNMWLLPVLYVPGSLLLVGPTIAKILYVMLLWSVRKRLVTIQRRRAALDAAALA